MAELTLHGIWELMRDSSAANSGDPDYQQAHVDHFKWAQGLSYDETVLFQALCAEIADRFRGFNSMLAALAEQTSAEAGVSMNVMQWTTQDLLKFVGVAQTKGAYTDVLVTSVLIEQNIPLAFSFIEPSEDEQFVIPEDFEPFVPVEDPEAAGEEEEVAGD